MIVIGVDPGMNGAAVVMDIEKSIIHKHRMPRIAEKGFIDVRALSKIFENYKNENAIVVIEEVHAMHNSAAKATFNFGMVCGMIEMAAVAHGFSYSKVQPKTWQKAMHEGIPLIKKLKKGNKKETVDRKAMSLIAVKRLFPEVELRVPNKTGGFYKNPHDGIVDSILIAEYARRYVV